MAKKTTEKTLDTLFDAFVDALKERLDDGEATAADLNVVRQFLKDNGVDFVPEGDSNEEREKLADLLPFKSDDAAAA